MWHFLFRLHSFAARRMSEAQLRDLRSCGKNVRVRSRVSFINPGQITLGDDVSINEDAYFMGGGGITIGNDVRIGPGAMLVTTGHPVDDHSRQTGAPITISDHVWIGARAIILPGVCIAERAVVAAGAVVTKSVDAGAVVAGVPAKLIRTPNAPTAS